MNEKRKTKTRTQKKKRHFFFVFHLSFLSVKTKTQVENFCFFQKNIFPKISPQKNQRMKKKNFFHEFLI